MIASQTVSQLPSDWRFCMVATPKATGEALKRPFEQNWQKKPYTAETIVNLIKKGRCQNYGLLFGHAGLIGLDVDGDRPHQRLLEIAEGQEIPETVKWTSGKPGRYHLAFCLSFEQEEILEDAIKQSGEPDKGRWYERFDVDGSNQDLDFRWKNCQSLLPPSLHPSGERYHWIVAPDETEVAEMPDWLFMHLLSLVVGEAEAEGKPSEPATQSWAQFDRTFNLPISDVVPLEICLSRVSRDALDGVSKGGRNDAGAKLARDLIGTAAYLDSIGQRYDDLPEQLFNQFCSACNPPIKGGEVQAIWKSAQKSNPGASLSPDMVESCIKGWKWKQVKGQSPEPINNPVAQPESEKPLLIDRQSIDEESQRLKLDLQYFLKETDRVQKIVTLNRICTNYRISKQTVSDLIAALEEDNNPIDRWRFSGKEFFEQETDAIDYIIPRYLPVAESILLCSDAGVGKTALITDMVHAILSGTEFLGEKVARPGKVLVISSDESPRSTRRRFIARGIDLSLVENLEVWTRLDITQLDALERYLEDQRPSAVFIDSITTVCQNVGISEKDPEFARYLYKLKGLVNRYNAALVVIHHANKDPLARGIKKVSGSARIPAAFWGVFLLERWDEKNPENPYRLLDMVKSRETETFKVKLLIHQRHEWLQTGIFSFEDDSGKEKEYKSRSQDVLNLLQQYSPVGLEYQEIANTIGIQGSYLYRVLDRLEDSRMIGKRRSETDKRRWVYFAYPLSPPQNLTLVEQYPETNTTQEFQRSENLTPVTDGEEIAPLYLPISEEEIISEDQRTEGGSGDKNLALDGCGEHGCKNSNPCADCVSDSSYTSVRVLGGESPPSKDAKPKLPSRNPSIAPRLTPEDLEYIRSLPVIGIDEDGDEVF